MPARTQEMAIGRGILQAIFAVFLGLMITAVVGVGVYTFHPSPADATQEQVDALYQQRGQIDGCSGTIPKECRSWEQLTAAERQEIEEISAQVTVLEEQLRTERESWSQSTSIILITLATVLMAISLLLGESLTVLSNGILLGGLFTMLYGVGWGIASGNSMTRFVVLVVALLVSLLLGYLKFVRGRGAARAAASGASVPAVAGEAPDTTALADLSSRVADLEARLSGAAALLAAPERPGNRDGSPGA
jgi:Tfp pilus assembly protein FimV